MTSRLLACHFQYLSTRPKRGQISTFGCAGRSCTADTVRAKKAGFLRPAFVFGLTRDSVLESLNVGRNHTRFDCDCFYGRRRRNRYLRGVLGRRARRLFAVGRVVNVCAGSSGRERYFRACRNGTRGYGSGNGCNLFKPRLNIAAVRLRSREPRLRR